ncbi:DUF2269 domain-containing protein [Mesorhizobium sp. LHD-90]|uniref:DUF2269 family protein n=1 Tax=Mesorhizobium sp. LHD-90 TaxID=3071414 RepID=UPI0027E0DC7C|nr:DUF2269 domain-containing protein [Mesorhizobium sp. LHD-90]MDQ6433551.1 DUF2269 domain-containing protein [Mesorhizobium sp. LHD-90]
MEDLLRLVHVLGAAVLFGTGAGIAFFMVMVHRTRDPKTIAHVAGTVVVADTVFTATAVILQPITGAWLALRIGWPLSEGWIVLSLALYVVTGLFWLPVVVIQIRLRDLARRAGRDDSPLPAEYFRLYRIWFAFGFPAFFAVIGIFWLMLTKPAMKLF